MNRFLHLLALLTSGVAFFSMVALVLERGLPSGDDAGLVLLVLAATGLSTLALSRTMRAARADAPDAPRALPARKPEDTPLRRRIEVLEAIVTSEGYERGR